MEGIQKLVFRFVPWVVRCCGNNVGDINSQTLWNRKVLMRPGCGGTLTALCQNRALITDALKYWLFRLWVKVHMEVGWM